MNSLKKIKSNFHRSETASFILLNFIQIQLVTMFFAKMKMSPYQEISQVTIINFFISRSQNYLIYGLFAISLIIIMLFALSNLVKPTFFLYSESIHHGLITFFKIFPFVCLVPLFLWNLNLVINSQNVSITCMSLFNLVLYSLLTVIHQVTNETTRIVQKDFCNLKNPSIITPILLILTLLSFQFSNPMLLLLMLISKSIFKIFNTFRCYQIQLIQKIDIFYGSFFIYLSLIGIVAELTKTTILQQYTQAFFLLFLGVFLCYEGIQKNFYCLLNMKLCKSSLLKIVNQVDEQNMFAENRHKIIENFQNQSRMLISIYLERLKIKEKQQNNYDMIWKYFVRKMINHKINCSNLTCECKTPARSGKQHQNENIMFLKTILTDFQSNVVLPGEIKSKIFKIYMTLQIQNAPLKAHHELIQLKNQKLNLFQELQVDNLLNQTKQCFDKIFAQKKVQNQNIAVTILIEAEQKLKQIKMEAQETLEALLNFYEKILQPSCSMNDIKNRSLNLNFKKKNLYEKIAYFIQNFQAKSEELSSLIFVYQKILQVYHDQSFQILLEKAQLKRKLLKKGQVDVFQPEYGTILIDLVKGRGKIVNITNNLCKGFGHQKVEMINKNINNFMPRIFGRYHDKFLRNFIQRGSFKILRSKEKVFFARNRKKFIFPINVRLKIQYELRDNFYATTLIRPLKSNSNFIIANQNGKIQQVTEGLYQKIFKDIFKQQVGKVKNLSIFKMLLSLNHHVKNNQYGDQDRIFQGIILSSQSIETMESFGMRKDLNLAGSMSEAKDLMSVQNSTSQTNLDSDLTVTQSKQKKISTKEKLKYFQDMFTPFLAQINIERLKGFRVKYKYSIIQTSEFDCDLIEIINISKQTQSNCFKKETITQLFQIANLYEIQQKSCEKLQKFKEKYEELVKNQNMNQNQEIIDEDFQEQSQKQFQIKNKIQKIKKDIKQMQTPPQNIWQKLQMNLNNQQNQGKKQILNTQNSESSSLLVNQDNSSSKKQMFKIIFNQQQVSIDLWMIGANILMLMIVLVMLSIGAYGMNHIFLQKQLFDNNVFILKLRQLVQFRSGFNQLELFYKNMNITMPHYMSIQNKGLYDQMNSLMENINSAITQSKSGFIYLDLTIDVIDQNTLQPYTISFLSMLQKFQKILALQNNSFEFFRLNYQAIHLFLKQNLDYVIGGSTQIVSDVYMSNGKYMYRPYWCILFVTFIFLTIWERRSNIKQDQILQMLNYNGVKQIRSTIESIKQIQKIMKNQNQSVQGNVIQKKKSGLEISVLMPSLKVQTNKPLKIIKQPLTFFNIKFMTIIFLVLLFLSNISIVAIFLFQLTDNYLMQADALLIGANDIKVKSFIFLNVGLKQINGFVQGRQKNQYSQEFLSQLTDGFFDFSDSMSLPVYQGSNITNYASQSFSEPISKVLNIQSKKVYKDISYQSFVTQMRNKFQLLLPILYNQQNITLDFLDNWIKDNDIINLLSAFQFLNPYRRALNTGLIDIFQLQIVIQIIGMTLFCLFFIPLNTFVLLIMRRKIKNYLQNLIKNAQTIFRHFSVQALSQNMYIVSYFNEKVKKKSSQKS